MGYHIPGGKFREPKARGKAKLDAEGFVILWGKAEYGQMEMKLRDYRRAQGSGNVAFRPGSLSSTLPPKLAEREGAGEAWREVAQLTENILAPEVRSLLPAAAVQTHCRMPDFVAGDASGCRCR